VLQIGILLMNQNIATLLFWLIHIKDLMAAGHGDKLKSSGAPHDRRDELVLIRNPIPGPSLIPIKEIQSIPYVLNEYFWKR
jgi:hypothetical protein